MIADGKLYQSAVALLGILLLVPCLAPQAAAVDRAVTLSAARATQTLANADTRLSFSTDVDLRLLSVENLKTGATFEFVDKVPWQLFLRNTTSGSQMNVNPDTHSNTFNYVYTDHGAYKEIVATWQTLTISAGNVIDTVVVTATLDNNEILAEMKIDVTTSLTDYSLFKVFFPEFNIKPIGVSGTDDFYTYPEHGGYIIDDPVNKLDPIGWPHPGFWSMQFFTYFDDSGLLYMATDDVDGFIKIYGMFGSPGNNSVYWRLENYPEDHTLPTVDYSMPFAFKIGPMDADWYDASQFYKEWALSNLVTRKRLDDPATDFPKSLLDIDGLVGYGIWHTPYGLTPALLQGVKDSKAFYGVDKIANILYRWTNEEGTAASWPEVTPVANIAPGIASMHADGDLVWLYVQMAYDVTLPSYTTNNIEQYTIKDINGITNKYLTLAWIDPYLAYWQNFSRDWNVDLTELVDADGIYWDFWSGLNIGDYDATHGHPVGGGDYQMEGKLIQVEMTRDAIQQIPGREDWFLGSEYFNEFFVDTNEIEMWNKDTWNLGEMPRIRLPLYEIVFGDRQYLWELVQTNPIFEPGWDNSNCYANASKMSIGLVLGFSGDSFDPYDPGSSTHGQEGFEFLGTLLRTYEYARPYLLHGELQKNVQVNSVGSATYESILPVSVYELANHWVYTPSYPEVSYIIPSVWQSYNDEGNESFAIVLINWFENQQSINYTFHFDDYGLTKGRPYRLMELDANGLHQVQNVRDDFTRTDVLAKRSIKVFVIKPVVDRKEIDGKQLKG